MIYFDNAATTRFKPRAAINALLKEVKRSSNSCRSGHDDAVRCALKNEECRRYLLKAFGAEDDYYLIFTKNCTEALNLAIFGYLNGKEDATVITSAIEHNSVLRPLFKLKKDGKIKLRVINPVDNGAVSVKHIANAADGAELVALNLMSNVTGAINDVAEIAKYLDKKKTIFLVDGAQGIPLYDINMKEMKIDMLPMPGHKGLHGVQGTGFLIFRRDLELAPLLYGGTGTSSDSVYQPHAAPEAYEAGTVFSAGFHALYEGAKWSFDNKAQNRARIAALTKLFLYNLGYLGAKCYAKNPHGGIVSFSFEGIDPSDLADILNRNYGIAVRSGLHCAPLIHNHMGTLESGLVRVSFGVDNTEKEVAILTEALEKTVYKTGLKK